jgi:hypothetical protein
MMHPEISLEGQRSRDIPAIHPASRRPGYRPRRADRHSASAPWSTASTPRMSPARPASAKTPNRHHRQQQHQDRPGLDDDALVIFGIGDPCRRHRTRIDQQVQFADRLWTSIAPSRCIFSPDAVEKTAAPRNATENTRISGTSAMMPGRNSCPEVEITEAAAKKLSTSTPADSARGKAPSEPNGQRDRALSAPPISHDDPQAPRGCCRMTLSGLNEVVALPEQAGRRNPARMP